METEQPKVDKIEKDVLMGASKSILSKPNRFVLVVLKICVIIAVVFIFGVLFIYISGGFRPKLNQDTNNLVQSQPAISQVEREKTVLTGVFAQLSFPDFVSKTDVDSSQLPSDLQKFVRSDGKNLKVQQVEYQDKTDGFIADYEVQILSEDNPNIIINNVYLGLMSSGSSVWKMVGAQHSGEFGFLELNKSDSQMRVSFSWNKVTRLVEVNIQTKNNK